MANSAIDNSPLQQRSVAWYRAVCVVLLAATFLNYADRFAFTQNAVRVQEALQIDEEGYGSLAGYFGLGFALGGLLFGILADWINVRFLYPFVVVMWSLAGISSGFMTDLFGMGVSRFALGLFEAGHWPCALRTTQRIFRPDQRTWANSLLQSGASLGAVVTPLVVLGLLRWAPSSWQWIFFITGGVGIPWAIVWLWTVSSADLTRPVIQTDESGAGRGRQQQLQEEPFWRLFVTRRWWILLLVVVSINTLWHYVRVWMPLILERDHGYSPEFVQVFIAIYYAATFCGSLASGWLTLRLVGRNWNVHRARLTVFLVFAVLSGMSIPAAFAPAGPLLLGLLVVVAFGSLGLFPIYYSLNQELSAKNQGKVGGTLGFSTWALLALIHPIIGGWVDADPTIRPWLFATVGIGPMIGFLCIATFWGKRPVNDTAAPLP